MEWVKAHFGRRLEALEKTCSADPIELLMPDGRVETLYGYTGDSLLDMFRRAMQE